MNQFNQGIVCNCCEFHIKSLEKYNLHLDYIPVEGGKIIHCPKCHTHIFLRKLRTLKIRASKNA